ncbi:isochorismate synthase [Stenotrophomonas sp. PD6]|uniref:isochorismate synthase n=1 Tax=Stenotrophomonas sp. PD6 TaxID=3368612 RepID=UPI003BA04F7C
MNDTLRQASSADDAAFDVNEPVAAPQFLLRMPGHTLDARGCRARLPRGGTGTLAARVHAFFASPQQGPALLVGMLPFDPAADDALHQPQWLATAAAGSVAPPLFRGEVRAEPSAAVYADAVEQALQALRGEPAALAKVVLARTLRVQVTAALDPRDLAARLGRDPSVTTYLMPLPVAGSEAPAWLVGASPELLVSRRGRQVLSHPLAGSARRCADSADDARAAQALLASGKDHDEHRHVVEAIVDALAPWCSQIDAPSQPALHATHSMWHLGTRIEATLRDPATPVATLLAALHPTPAVCGTPRDAALDMIRSLEPVPRGFYAGAVGWMDAHGDGDWYVAIRCARVQGSEARIFAGAGIVAGSEPALEVAETAAKFAALLTALGADAAPVIETRRS